MLTYALPFLALFAASVLSSPLSAKSRSLHARADTCSKGISGPFLDPSFPDPSILHIGDTWYSFATSGGIDVQGAKSTSFDSGWSRVTQSPILAVSEATWTGKRADGRYGLWAPDVMQRTSDQKFVMYFAALDKTTIGTSREQHCIGAAISDTITGVYHPQSDFVQCNRTSAGVIDPAWFKDSNNKQYVVYKTEIPDNYLEIREVTSSGAKEGVEWAGDAKKLLQVNGQGHSDGNNMEAPYIFKRGSTYFLTFSTHFTGDGTYDVEYATSDKVTGPYTRADKPLLQTTDDYGCSIIGPGGASFQRLQEDASTVRMIFHGLTAAKDINKRVVYTATVQVDGNKLSIKS